MVLACIIPFSTATQLGMNYYMESMMSERWQVPYIPRTISEVGQDFDHIKQVSSHVKLYMNPFVNANLPWVEQIAAQSESRGFFTVVNMMVDDRDIHDGNWWDYRNRVLNACSRLNGKVDSILVGNEISLHSPWDKYAVRARVEPLMNDCRSRFSGEVSYEAFWYEKEAWYNYGGRLYFMQYENLNSFKVNVQEMQSRFGSRAVVGEWGEDSKDEHIEKDDWWQRLQLEERWNAIAATDTPVAYIYTYKEPSWNGFGVVRPDGLERPVWSFLESISGEYIPAPQPLPEEEPVSGTHEGEIAAFSTSCGPGCTKQFDETAGVCRTVRWSNAGGIIQLQACVKNDGYVEMYRQSSASGDWQACINVGCVDNKHGFARFLPRDSDEPAPEPEPESPSSDGEFTGISSLSRSCSYVSGCSLQSDVTTGTCRTVRWSTSSGNIQIQGCEKGNDIELYAQQRPSGNWQACLGNGCVGDHSGFARWEPSEKEAPQPEAPEEPTVGGVAGLSVYSQPSGSLIKDITKGVCRTVEYSTSAGFIRSQICDKDSQYEMYLQSSVNGAQICVSNHCVGSNSGFVSW